MSGSGVLHRSGGPGEPRSGNGESSQPSTNTIPRSSLLHHGTSNVERPFPSSLNFDASESRGIVRRTSVQSSVLPPEKVFPVQVGSELFRLSGASITSDEPSYFTRFFEEQIRQNDEEDAVKTLYIDRDPTIFRDIARHLQGYYVPPLDGNHFVRLFADAQFYSLPRLISQLFESQTFIQIGDRHFQVPKDIFCSPGDSPNYFTLGFAAFFPSSQEVFPGLERTGLLRPPPIAPPAVPSKSAEVFAQLLHLLQGYPLHIRNEEHRAQLLRDCRYFHLRGVEQRLIPHEISYNPDRQSSEILLRLEDVKPSGISFVADIDKHSDVPLDCGSVHYSRPFVDTTAHELILEIGPEPTILDLRTNQLTFHGSTKAKVSALLQVIASKVDRRPMGSSPDDAKVRFLMDANTDLTLDGNTADADVVDATHNADGASGPQGKKRKLDADIEPVVVEWEVRMGQWRLRAKQEHDTGLTEIVFAAVKLDALTCQRARNARRRFLNEG